MGIKKEYKMRCMCNSRAAKRPLSLLEGPSSSLLCYVSWLSCGNKLVLMMENVSRASWCWLLQRLTKPKACFQLFIPGFFYHSLLFYKNIPAPPPIYRAA